MKREQKAREKKESNKDLTRKAFKKKSERENKGVFLDSCKDSCCADKGKALGETCVR